jgi:hypothetical protein
MTSQPGFVERVEARPLRERIISELLASLHLCSTTEETADAILTEVMAESRPAAEVTFSATWNIPGTGDVTFPKACPAWKWLGEQPAPDVPLQLFTHPAPSELADLAFAETVNAFGDLEAAGVARPTPKQFGEAITKRLKARHASELAEAQGRIDHLQALCAAAYQLAGAVDAPVEWLDALGDAANGEIGARFKGSPIDLLPIGPMHLDEIASLRTQLAAAQAALTEVRGCFDAALCEGLLERLAELDVHDVGSLADLVHRRLMYAHAAAIATDQPAQGSEG